MPPLISAVHAFQSTRPLRGATLGPEQSYRRPLYFNPRAPCGARRSFYGKAHVIDHISIHAPLAGRDHILVFQRSGGPISIHAPLAGRDHNGARLVGVSQLISIHAPLAGRDHGNQSARGNILFQSTRPLRGATRRTRRLRHRGCHFNPGAPCGARRPAAPAPVRRK